MKKGLWLINKYILPEFHVFCDEVVIYQKGSGFTHLINLFGAEILKLLLVKPRTTQEIMGILIQSTANVEKQELSHYIQQYLEQCLLLEIVKYRS